MSQEPPPLSPTLREAVRRARLEDAERGAAQAGRRAADLARLEALSDALAPVLAGLPEGALFNHALVPGDPPRLHVDILGLVEMAPDGRRYRFAQDSRWGRRLIADTESLPDTVSAVTDYLALRLVEREKALASDGLGRPVLPPNPVPEATPERPSRLLAFLWFVAGLVAGAAGLYALSLLHARMALGS